MAMLIPVTQMNGVPMLVGSHGIKMIESATYIPDTKHDLPAGKKGETVPATTQPMADPPATVPVTPIVCSKITFHDDKALVVKETIDVIATSAGK